MTFPPEIVSAMGGAPPTEEQWRAITTPLEPTVLIAGAGSGKTSVIAARVVYLALAALGRLDATEGALPGNVLALTFTVKATENLRSRIRRALRDVELDQGEEPEILNYHALAAQVIDRYGILAGIDWAVSNGCAVISMSLGADVPAGTPYSQIYETVAQRAMAKGTLIIAAAGNASMRPARIAPVGHPARCPSIIAVAAIDVNRAVASFSSGSADKIGQIDVCAPGVDVYSSFKLPEKYRRLVDPYDAKADLTARARSYLHANCAQCHVEAGGGNAQMELEFTTTLERMRIVDVKPLHHTFGLPDARLVAPGNPERSALLHRVANRDAGHMPPLATSVVDQQAVRLLRDWIAQLKPEGGKAARNR